VKPYQEIEITACSFCGGNDFETIAKPKDFRVSQKVFPVVRCKSCNHVFTNPRPADADLGVFYESEDYISHTNSSKGLFNKAYQIVRKFALQQKRKLVEKHHPSKGALLDIGCGTGDFLNVMKNAGWQVSGVEESVVARQQAVDRFHLDVVPGQSVFEKEPQSLDVITLWHVLEHLPNLNAYFELFQRLLKPSGVLIIAVPNHESFDAQFYKDDWAAWDVPIHVSHFSKTSLHNWADKYGFEISAIQNMPFDSFYVSMLSEKNRKNTLVMPRGFNLGLVSNIRAKQNNASSLIYILKKK